MLAPSDLDHRGRQIDPERIDAQLVEVRGDQHRFGADGGGRSAARGFARRAGHASAVIRISFTG
jgi:hypothetical protein